MASTSRYPARNTGSFYAQAVASFVVAAVALAVGVYHLDVDAWQRAFLGLGVLYAVTSAFTLAKVIRDRQEDGAVRGPDEVAQLR